MPKSPLALAILSFCVVGQIAISCHAQDTEPSGFNYVVVNPKKIDTEMAPNEDTKSLDSLAERFKVLQQSFVDRIEKLKMELAEPSTTPERKKELETLIPKLTKELKRVQDTLIEIMGLKKPGEAPPIDPKTNPFVPENPDPDVYDGSKDDPSKQMLQLAATAICVAQPQYCPFVMIIAEMLNLDSGTIHEKVAKMRRVHGVLNAKQIGEAELNELIALTKSNPALGQKTLEALIKQGNFAGKEVADRARTALNDARQSVAMAFNEILDSETNPPLVALINDLKDGSLDTPPTRFANKQVRDQAEKHARALQVILGRNLEEAIAKISNIPVNN